MEGKCLSQSNPPLVFLSVLLKKWRIIKSSNSEKPNFEVLPRFEAYLLLDQEIGRLVLHLE
jgi:hypothetical protein